MPPRGSGSSSKSGSSVDPFKSAEQHSTHSQASSSAIPIVATRPPIKPATSLHPDWADEEEEESPITMAPETPVSLPPTTEPHDSAPHSES